MHALTWLATTANPTPTPTMTVDPDTVTPGFAGFVAIAVLAVAVVFLLIDMLRRIRRAGYRSEITEQLDAEAAAAEDAAEAGEHEAASDEVSPEGPAKD